VSDESGVGAVMKSEMNEQPEVLARLAERSSELGDVIQRVRPDPLAGVVFLGRGSSGNVGTFGRYVMEMATGRPTSLLAPSLLTRYVRTPDYRGQLVIALSQSGMTTEIIESCQVLRDHCGAKVIGITNNANSDLASVVDACVTLEAGEERAIPATKTVTAQMLAVLILASTLGSIESIRRIDQLPQRVTDVLNDWDSPAALVDRWLDFDRLFIASRGVAYAAALEASLKIKESASLFCQGLSTGDLRHGVVASVSTTTPVLGIAPAGPVAADVHRLLEDLAELGVPVARCSPASDADLPLPADTGEMLQTILAVVRAQQLALTWSIRRGLNPDEPDLLSKVTQGT
jgi:glucosamine--fructose-6-phosphate aminotransferase (isomerizing)